VRLRFISIIPKRKSEAAITGTAHQAALLTVGRNFAKNGKKKIFHEPMKYCISFYSVTGTLVIDLQIK
jgi:hypothetical protein